MQCAKCGLDLPPGVKSCPKCGLVNEFVGEQALPKKQPMVLYIALALLAVTVLALAVALIAGRGNENVTSAPSGAPGPPGNVTSAPSGAPAGGNVVSAPPGQPAPPDTAPSSTPKPKPPKAVLDYLEHVKRVESHRQNLLKDTGEALTLAVAGQAMSLEKMLDWVEDDKGGELADPLADARKELSRQYKNWLSTLQYFDGKAAPPECREFSGAYRQVLYQETLKIGKTNQIFSGIKLTDSRDMAQGLGALQKMKGDPQLQGSIDQSADNADSKLTQLVSNYDMEKPFDVPREQASGGSIMGF